MKIGDAVEVHSTFEDTWSSGFEIADIVDGGFAVRRMSDGSLLPAPTGPRDVRPATVEPDIASVRHLGRGQGAHPAQRRGR